MRNFRGNSSAIIVGAATGAILMSLVIMMIFGLKTGIAGAVLVVLIMAVAVAFGWLIGVQYRIRENNYISYQKGYHEGLAKRTVIIEQPQGRCSFMIDERYVEM